MSNRNPTEHEVFRHLEEELLPLAAEVYSSRVAIDHKERKKKTTVEEGTNERTIPPQGPPASPFTRPRFLKQSRTTLPFYSSFQVSNLWLVHITIPSCCNPSIASEDY